MRISIGYLSYEDHNKFLTQAKLTELQEIIDATIKAHRWHGHLKISMKQDQETSIERIEEIAQIFAEGLKNHDISISGIEIDMPEKYSKAFIRKLNGIKFNGDSTGLFYIDIPASSTKDFIQQNEFRITSKLGFPKSLMIKANCLLPEDEQNLTEKGLFQIAHSDTPGVFSRTFVENTWFFQALCPYTSQDSLRNIVDIIERIPERKDDFLNHLNTNWTKYLLISKFREATADQKEIFINLFEDGSKIKVIFELLRNEIFTAEELKEAINPESDLSSITSLMQNNAVFKKHIDTHWMDPEWQLISKFNKAEPEDKNDFLNSLEDDSVTKILFELFKDEMLTTQEINQAPQAALTKEALKLSFQKLVKNIKKADWKSLDTCISEEDTSEEADALREFSVHYDHKKTNESLRTKQILIWAYLNQNKDLFAHIWNFLEENKKRNEEKDKDNEEKDKDNEKHKSSLTDAEKKLDQYAHEISNSIKQNTNLEDHYQANEMEIRSYLSRLRDVYSENTEYEYIPDAIKKYKDIDPQGYQRSIMNIEAISKAVGEILFDKHKDSYSYDWLTKLYKGILVKKIFDQTLKSNFKFKDDIKYYDHNAKLLCKIIEEDATLAFENIHRSFPPEWWGQPQSASEFYDLLNTMPAEKVTKFAKYLDKNWINSDSLDKLVLSFDEVSFECRKAILDKFPDDSNFKTFWKSNKSGDFLYDESGVNIDLLTQIELFKSLQRGAEEQQQIKESKSNPSQEFNKAKDETIAKDVLFLDYLMKAPAKDAENYAKYLDKNWINENHLDELVLSFDKLSFKCREAILDKFPDDSNFKAFWKASKSGYFSYDESGTLPLSMQIEWFKSIQRGAEKQQQIEENKYDSQPIEAYDPYQIQESEVIGQQKNCF